MLLNFEVLSDSFAPKVTFKGGKWKDRHIAKKKAAWYQSKQHEAHEASVAEDVSNHEPPTKRQRLSETKHYSNHEVPSELQSNPRSSQAYPTAYKSVISSLFRHNPSSVATKSATDPVEDRDIEPSNAPLKDGTESFIQLGVSAVIANHLVKKMNVTAPTAIQQKALRHLCSAVDDAFIQAQTGSGKTLSYLLPIVQHISTISKHMKASGRDFSRDSGLFAIILAPTRELSKQIASVLETLLSCYPFINCGTVIGGEKKKSEKARLRKGVNILVATPGRLADHLEHTEVVDVSRVRWLVLDEGDRLMELGFENDIQKLIGTLNLRATKHQAELLPGLPTRRTTILCSATMKADVDVLRNIALKDAISIAVDDANGETDPKEQKAFSAPAQLRQSYAIVPAKQRLVTLAAVLKQSFKRKGTVTKAIVFISCADSVDFHFDVFSRTEQQSDIAAEEQLKNGKTSGRSKKGTIVQGLTISEHRTSGLATMFGDAENPVMLYRLHGSLQQATRTQTLKAFTNSTTAAVLLCTDVASRGLDLPNIELVIELDPPFSKEDHLHRVGRTARAGNDGRAMIFLQPGCEEGYVQILKDTEPRSLTAHTADELLQKAFTSSDAAAGSAQMWQDRATDWQLDVERWNIERPLQHEQSMRAYQSHVRAYATHISAERSMFDIKQLHLGHLAKAFALREKPGDIRVPGARPTAAANAKAKSQRKADAGRESSSSKDRATYDATSGVSDAQGARRKMQAKARFMQGGASEFNLG